MVPLRLVVGKKQKDSNQALDFDEVRMPRLLSVNVGLPLDVTWNGKTVRTSIWKSPVRNMMLSTAKPCARVTARTAIKSPRHLQHFELQATTVVVL
jgi:hypothetical protein